MNMKCGVKKNETVHDPQTPRMIHSYFHHFCSHGTIYGHQTNDERTNHLKHGSHHHIILVFMWTTILH